jgi:hypothetical protein
MVTREHIHLSVHWALIWREDTHLGKRLN